MAKAEHAPRTELKSVQAEGANVWRRRTFDAAFGGVGVDSHLCPSSHAPMPD